MTHKFSDIDPSGLLPKQKECWLCNTKEHQDEIKGFNACKQEIGGLGIEVDVNKIKDSIKNSDLYNMGVDKYTVNNLAQAIASNPSILKLVKIKE